MHDSFSLTVLEEAASTNTVACDMARQGAPEGTIVRAKRQTAGKGRRGNVWTSAEGNLYASFIFRPQMPAALIGQLSFLMGLAVVETLADYLPPDRKVALKWPNDVLVDRRKIAGILLETEGGHNQSVGWVVAGVGVNMTAVEVENATSIEQEGGGRVDPALFLNSLAGRVLGWLNIWRGFGFEPIRVAFLDRAEGIGGPITARLPAGDVTGVFSGMNAEGALILSLPDGRERLITSGEVFF